MRNAATRAHTSPTQGSADPRTAGRRGPSARTGCARRDLFEAEQVNGSKPARVVSIALPHPTRSSTGRRFHAKQPYGTARTQRRQTRPSRLLGPRPPPGAIRRARRVGDDPLILLRARRLDGRAQDPDRSCSRSPGLLPPAVPRESSTWMYTLVDNANFVLVTCPDDQSPRVDERPSRERLMGR